MAQSSSEEPRLPSELFCWEVVQRIVGEGLQESGLHLGPTTTHTDRVHRYLSVGAPQMSANVNNFQETPENGSILVLEGRLATPLSFPSPEFLLVTRTNLTGLPWVMTHSHSAYWETWTRIPLGAGSRNTEKGKHRSPTILTVTWRDGAPGLFHLHFERQC